MSSPAQCGAVLTQVAQLETRGRGLAQPYEAKVSDETGKVGGEVRRGRTSRLQSSPQERSGLVWYLFDVGFEALHGRTPPRTPDPIGDVT